MCSRFEYAASEMRVIAGTLKGRKLQAPPPEDLRVRPTADRAREALFSILERWPKGAFVDLFAGTGAVALEALSRGFGPVACVEQEPVALRCLAANLRGSEIQVLKQDALRLGPKAFAHQAVIFGDPPYDQAVRAFERLAPALRSWVNPDGLLVWETDRNAVLPETRGWALLEQRDYGAARFHLMEPV